VASAPDPAHPDKHEPKVRYYGAYSNRDWATLIYCVFYIANVRFLEPNTSIARRSYGRSQFKKISRVAAMGKLQAQRTLVATDKNLSGPASQASTNIA